MKQGSAKCSGKECSQRLGEGQLIDRKGDPRAGHEDLVRWSEMKVDQGVMKEYQGCLQRVLDRYAGKYAREEEMVHHISSGTPAHMAGQLYNIVYGMSEADASIIAAEAKDQERAREREEEAARVMEEEAREMGEEVGMSAKGGFVWRPGTARKMMQPDGDPVEVVQISPPMSPARPTFGQGQYMDSGSSQSTFLSPCGSSQSRNN
jgi:hypothetical protein